MPIYIKIKRCSIIVPCSEPYLVHLSKTVNAIIYFVHDCLFIVFISIDFTLNKKLLNEIFTKPIVLTPLEVI